MSNNNINSSKSIDHLIGRPLVPFFNPDTNTENTQQLIYDDGRDYKVDSLKVRKFVDGVFVDSNINNNNNNIENNKSARKSSKQQYKSTQQNTSSNNTTPITTPQRNTTNQRHSSVHHNRPTVIQSSNQYAAPKFTASPAPNAIPMPKFLASASKQNISNNIDNSTTQQQQQTVTTTTASYNITEQTPIKSAATTTQQTVTKTTTTAPVNNQYAPVNTYNTLQQPAMQQHNSDTYIPQPPMYTNNVTQQQPQQQHNYAPNTQQYQVNAPSNTDSGLMFYRPQQSNAAAAPPTQPHSHQQPIATQPLQQHNQYAPHVNPTPQFNANQSQSPLINQYNATQQPTQTSYTPYQPYNITSTPQRTQQPTANAYASPYSAYAYKSYTALYGNNNQNNDNNTSSSAYSFDYGSFNK